jgi:hypothetical protein
MDSLTYASHQENLTVWNFKIAFSLINATKYFFYVYDVQLKLQPLDLEIPSTVALRLCSATYISVRTKITKPDSDSPSIYATLCNSVSTD